MEYISDYLILIECPSCGHEHYWEIGKPNKEHCPYCEFCSAPLTGKIGWINPEQTLWFEHFGAELCDLFGVTHWMSLPSPPEMDDVLD